MSSLLNLITGDLAVQIVAILGAVGAALAGLFVTKRSSYNKGKADAAAAAMKQVVDATRTRDEIRSGVDAASDDAVRERLRDKWVKPD